VRSLYDTDLDLPPLFSAISLRESGDAFAHAMRIASDSGAGTLVHVGRFDVTEFAVVLEPEEPLRTAKRAIYAGLVALADALAAHAPPEKPINFDWPDAIRVDGGLVGGGRLAWPRGADESLPPEWLVFGVTIRMTFIDEQDFKSRWRGAALDSEGFILSSHRLIESFARYLMMTIDSWQQDGFAPVARSYLSRLAPHQGASCSIDDNGDLLERHPGNSTVERRNVIGALETPAWLDPATGNPFE
jgi:Biotin/lipoate A/B protein ligase family